MILYINNEYCTSFEQLRSYFITLPEFGSNLYWDLIESGRDQAISQWLNEKIGYKDIAHQLESIDEQLGDTDYLTEMRRIILGGKVLEDDSVQVNKPTFSSCFSLENIELEQTNEKNTVFISLKVLTPMVNENFELRLETGWGIQPWSINPFNSKVDEVLKHEFSFFKLPNREFDCISLYADNELLSKFSVKENNDRRTDKSTIQDKSSTITGNKNHSSSRKYYYGMFKINSSTEIDLRDIDTSNETDMTDMFYRCSSLKALDLSSFDTSNVTNMGGMFEKCSSLKALDLSSFDTSKVTSMFHMFCECFSLKALDLSSFDTSNVTNMGDMFCGCPSLEALNLNGFDTSKATNMGGMFVRCSSLEALDLSNFNTSNVTFMSGMFCGCSSLKALDLSSFDTSNVTNMGGMFEKCSSLKALDLSNFDTSKATDMGSMFGECSSLEALDLSSFDTSNVSSMKYMFYKCSSLKVLDLSGFDTSNVLFMEYMFKKCSSLKKLILKKCNDNTVKRITNRLREAGLYNVEIVHDTLKSQRTDSIGESSYNDEVPYYANEIYTG